MNHPDTTPRVLTVGAYERDNFGDLLFLLLTERYLTGSEIVASAPFAADMTELLDRQVVATGEHLQQHRYDVVWSVGGQVGALDLEGAFRMAVPPGEFAAYQTATPARQREILSAAVAGAPITSPYVPTVGAFPLNGGAVSVLNSVGIAGLTTRSVKVRHEMAAVLQTADVVSVRDKPSSKYLQELGVEHTLAPDVVHTLRVLEPYEPDPDSDVVVLQVSSGLAALMGHETIAEQLAASRHLGGSKVRFVMAGLATSHDSVADCERIAERLQQLSPSTEIEFATGRQPLDVVKAIRDARLVIGTSLHVRIVAASYDLPRVTFERTKPTRYARHWDKHMPFHVAVTDLDEAMGAALGARNRPEVREASARLSRLADENVRAIADRVGELTAGLTDAVREERAETRLAALAAAAEAAHHDLPGIRDELDATQARLDETRTVLARTRASLAEAQAQAVPAGRPGLAERVLRRAGRRER
ncbi:MULTISPECIES: polysaccharide pyruvyl transferase family protein [unclassified Nocardioides]|uniref:polysaccharide pyruvyl transferase family protein n=1 Tax=unclassified Nocardioides TaxID=2615069 RepID=UPI0030147B12